MSKPDIEIRVAVSEDAAALSDLIYNSKQSNGYSDAMMALFAANDALRITEARLTTHRFWVAHRGPEILGCVALAPHDGQTGEIRTFFVAPEHKGKGVGTRLWRALVTIAQSQGLSRLTVKADPFSVPFYETLGFVTVQMRESGAIKGRMIPHMVCDI